MPRPVPKPPAAPADLDKRVQRTRAALSAAVIELVELRGYEQISIRDIAERAGIGYATFFRHYPDKETLLLEMVDEVMDRLMLLLDVNGPGSPETVGTRLFEFAAANESLCRLVLKGPATVRLVQRIMERGTASALASAAPIAAGLPPEIAAHHLVATSLSLLDWWLGAGRPYPPQRMGEVYRRLVLEPARGDRR